MGLVVEKEFFNFLVLELSLHFDIATFFPKIFQLLFEKFDALYFRYISIFHMISFLNKMNESLRFYEPISKFFLIFRPCVFLKIKYFMSCCIFRLFWLFYEKIVKVVYQIQ